MAEDIDMEDVAFADSQREQDPGTSVQSVRDSFLSEPEPPKELANSLDNYKDLATWFEVSEQEIKDWLEGKCFTAFWNIYANEYLGPALEKAKKAGNRTLARPELESIIARINQGERRGIHEYSGPLLKKQRWDDLDHVALFFVQCQI